MNDERMLVLQMLEKGKITAAEAAALLEALQVGPEKDSNALLHDGDTPLLDSAGGKAKDYVDKTRERVEESIKKLRDTLRDKGPGREEIDNVVKHVQKGISRVLDELPDVMTRLGTLDFRAGPGHSFEDTFAGRLSPDAVAHIRVDNADGRIQVEEGEGLSYQVRVLNRVHIEDEAKARSISDQAIEWHASDGGFELTVGNHPKVASRVLITLPRNLKYAGELSSEYGSIVWRDLIASDLLLHAENGSIAIERTQAERIQAHSSNGSINIKHIHAEHLDVATTNGIIRLDGFAQSLRCRTEHGSVRAKLTPQTAPPAPASPLQWDISSENGSVHVALPTGDEYGHNLELRTANGRVSTSLTDLDLSEPKSASELIGKTAAYESKPRHAQLTVHTANGSIRVDGVEQEEGAEPHANK